MVLIYPRHTKIFEELKDIIQVVSSSKEATITSAERRKLIPAYVPPNIINLTLLPDGFQITVPDDGKLAGIRFYGRMHKPFTGKDPYEFDVKGVRFNKTNERFVYQNRDFVTRANKTLYYWLFYLVNAGPNDPPEVDYYGYLADHPCNYTFDKSHPPLSYLNTRNNLSSYKYIY